MIFGDWAAGTFGGDTLPLILTYGFNTAAASTTVAVTKPTGVAIGDLLLGICGAGNPSRTFTAPSGFSEVADTNGVEVATRTADGSEGASFTFTADLSDTLLGAVVRISRWTTVTVGAVTNSGNAAGSITMPKAGLLVAYFFGSGPSTTALSAPSGMSQFGTTQVQGNNAEALFSEYVPSGSTGSRVTVPTGGSARGVLIGITN